MISVDLAEQCAELERQIEGPFLPSLALTLPIIPCFRCAELENLTLILCSDGIWDLWEYEDVFQGIASPPTADGQSIDAAKAFFDKSVDRGAEMFEDTADNMTGIVVYLNPKGVPQSAARPLTETPAKSGSRAGGIDPSLFSV